MTLALRQTFGLRSQMLMTSRRCSSPQRTVGMFQRMQTLEILLVASSCLQMMAGKTLLVSSKFFYWNQKPSIDILFEFISTQETFNFNPRTIVWSGYSMHSLQTPDHDISGTVVSGLEFVWHNWWILVHEAKYNYNSVQISSPNERIVYFPMVFQPSYLTQHHKANKKSYGLNWAPSF